MPYRDQTWGPPSPPHWQHSEPPSGPHPAVLAAELRHMERRLDGTDRRLDVTEQRQEAGEQRKNAHQQRLGEHDSILRHHAELLQSLMQEHARLVARVDRIETWAKTAAKVSRVLVKKVPQYGIALMAFAALYFDKAKPEVIGEWLKMFGHLFGLPGAGH